MGLDLLEFVMALEKEFCVEISDEFMEKAPTVLILFREIRRLQRDIDFSKVKDDLILLKKERIISQKIC